MILYSNSSYDTDYIKESTEVINEEKIFGVKIDKNKLNDEKYVRELIKDINKASKDKKTSSTLVGKIIGILTLVSLVSIIGIPIAILLAGLTIVVDKIKYDIDTKDLKKIDTYLEKCIKKLKDAEAKAEGKEKKQYTENIAKIEKNRQRIHDKINIEGSRKRKLYGEKLSEDDIKKLFNLIKKDLSPIVEKYNKSKKTEIRKALDDYLNDVISDEDDEEDIQFWKDNFGKYYSSGTPTMKCNKYESHDNTIIITLFEDVGSKQMAEALLVIVDKIGDEFKQKTKLSEVITTVRENYWAELYIEYDVTKVQEYLNSPIKESYIEEANLFGEKIDQNMLHDEKYVRELTKKIKETTPEDYKNRQKKRELFSTLSLLSLVGIYTIPLMLLFEALIIKLDMIDCTEKELDLVRQSIDYQIKKVEKDRKLSKEEKDKMISKLEKNRDSIKIKQTKAKASSKDYENGNINITKDIRIFSLTASVLDGTSIEEAIKDIESMKNNRKKYPEETFDDYIEEVIIGGYTTESKLMTLLNKNKGKAEYYIDLYQLDDDDSPLNKKVYNQIKGKTLSDVIEFQSDYALIYCHEDKCCYYFSPKHGDIFAKCTLSQFIKGANKSYNDLMKIIKEADIKESYTPERGEIKMKSINSLASIARSYGIEPTANRLRDDIVEEYTDMISSLSMVDESVIVRDIALLPVYKINEYTETEDDIIDEGSMDDALMEGEMKRAKKILDSGKISKIKSLRKSMERQVNTKKKNFENHKNLSKEQKERMNFSEIEKVVKAEIAQKEKIIKMCDAKLKQLEKIKEGYAIDLDSLKFVVESKGITLEEAIQEIRDANYIGDTYPMYCVLPSDINEHMTLESFISVNDALNNSGIIPVAITELSHKDWKEVGKEYKYTDRFRFKQTLDNIKDILKNMSDNPQKTGNFEKIRPRLLNMVDKCKTIEDVNYLKRDLNAGKVQLTKMKQNNPDMAKQIDSHIKWLETEYKDALDKKAKELKAKK